MLKENLNTSEAIYAIASGKLPSSVCIIRISGEKTLSFAKKLTQKQIEKKGMYFCSFYDDKGCFIDEGLILFFKKPNSLTGEDIIEIQCHGAFSVVKKIIEFIESFGIRQAENGEFLYRRYLNDKISQHELEILSDVYHSTQPFELELIYQRKEGTLLLILEKLRQSLTSLQAVIETGVDFSDEYSNVTKQMDNHINEISHMIEKLIHRYELFHKPISYPKIVIAGLPNAGKSSLFNAILGRYRSIVHKEEGTTRDVIEEDLEMEGKKWKLVDTAGIRKTKYEAEAIGVELAKEALQNCDFWILVVDVQKGITHHEENLLKDFQNKPYIVVYNKGDLLGEEKRNLENIISLRTGQGLDLFFNTLVSKLRNRDSERSPIPSQSQNIALRAVLSNLKEMKNSFETIPLEYIAEKNRQNIALLSKTIGEVSSEDILENIFKQFCIGK